MKKSEDAKRKNEIKKQNRCNFKFLSAVKACVECTGKIVNTEEVKKQVDLGADVNCFNSYGHTALIIQLKTEDIFKENLFRYLLSLEDIDVNYTGDDPFEITALMRAAELENHKQALEMCKLLVAKGANVRAKSKLSVVECGANAIYYAKIAGNKKLVEFLEQKLEEEIIDGTEDSMTMTFAMTSVGQMTNINSDIENFNN